MFKLAVIVAFFVTAMVAAKETTVLQRAGLFSSCSAVPGQAYGSVPLQACSPGKLDGRPDLSRKSCASRGIVAEVEYWACPVPLVGDLKP